MDIKQEALRDSAGKESIWREKYLESLETQEKETAQQQETINTLRRGLLSVSLAGDGIDQELDTSLASLRRQLHKLDQQAELNSLLQTIEEKLLELDNKKVQKADGMLTLLDVAALSLGKLRFAQPHKRAVRKFTRKLKKPGDDPQAQLALLEEFIQLCVTIFGNLLEKDGIVSESFWQRLFNRQAPPVKAAPQTSPPQSLDGDGPSNSLAAAEKIANTNDSGTDKSPSEPTASETSKVSPQPHGTVPPAESVKLSAPETEKMVKAFIYQLLDNIDSADAIKAVATGLRSKLLTTQGSELKNTLDQIHNLLNLASANERNALRKYLEELNESISQLSKFIGSSKGHSAALKQLNKSLDKDLRLKLSSIHTNIEAVSDLSEMKTAIKKPT